MTRRSLFAALAWLGLASWGLAAESPVRVGQFLAAGHPVRIVCFGDSITGRYYHTGGRRAWSDLLAIALERIYPGARLEVINAGVSGETTVAGLQRIDRDVLGRHPQLVVVMFGMNDSTRISLELYRANLRQIVARSRAAGIEVILMTPNSIDPGKTADRLALYAAAMRQIGRELGVPVADAFRAFEAVRAVSGEAWMHLMSEPMHPNLNGHKIFAEELAELIGGRRETLEDLPPLVPRLPRVAARLRLHQPIRVLAMAPYDRLIGPALQTLAPGAEIQVTAWEVGDRTLERIEAQAKEIKAVKSSDLIVLAIPADARAAAGESYFRAYSRVVNHVLSFSGADAWDCVAILPSIAQPSLNPAQRVAEELAREVVASKDLPSLQRAPGQTGQSADVLARWLSADCPPERATKGTPSAFDQDQPPAGGTLARRNEGLILR